MDSETLKKMGAIVREFTVPYYRKVWKDGDSLGGDWGITCDVAPGADVDAAMDAAYEYIKEVARRNMAPAMTAIVTKSAPELPRLVEAEDMSQSPLPSMPVPIEETREPVVGDSETETFDVDTIKITDEGPGRKYVKAKGGKWSKYGVTVYSEVLADMGWDLDDIAAGEYKAPKGLRAVALLEGGKPKKVLEWK